MRFSYDDKIRAGDLDNSYRDSLVKYTIDRIRDEKELMEEIREFIIDENPEATESQIESWIDLKIDEIAEEAIDRIRVYVEFDVEVILK